MLKSINTYLEQEKSNAPLIVFRILFGFMMAFSTIRFISMGWVESFYITPKLYFPFEGFYWLKPLAGNAMYIVFGIMILTSLNILLGFYYKISTTIFFLSFTYVELLDKSNYLNHYYFVSLMAFILIFLPANKRLSLDSYSNRVIATDKTNNYVLWIIKAQLAIVYIYAGIAKLNTDWILHALPLKIWLPAHSHLPVIGELLTFNWVAYLFSWIGAVYDLFIVFFLINNRTRIYAYILVIVFHILTRILFPIGMFPYIMIVSTLIFFSESFHEKILLYISSWFNIKPVNYIYKSIHSSNVYKAFFVIFICIQLLFPFRYLLYPGNLYWTEEGYRFSWRVMLMEKSGTAFFYIVDPISKRKIEVNNRDFLTMNQEKMMSTQPDILVQYAQHLKKHYEKIGYKNIAVKADVFVNLNGRGSQRFINSDIDLSMENNTWRAKKWILEYEK